MQFRSSKWIFVVKTLIKVGNLPQKEPHFAIRHFHNNIQGRKTILVRKLFILALAKCNLLNRTMSRFEARLVF